MTGRFSLGFFLAFMAFGFVWVLDQAHTFGSATSRGGRGPFFTPGELRIGEVSIGDVIAESVVLVNASDQSLRVSSVQASCGCTTVDSKSFVLAARESRRLALRIDSRHKAAGAFRGELSVSGHQGGKAVRLSVPVLADFVFVGRPNVTPPGLSLGRIPAGSKIGTRIRVEGLGVDSVNAIAVRCPEWLKADVKFEKSVAVVEFKGLAPSRTGVINERVTIHAAGSILDVPVSGSIEGAVAAFPERIVKVFGGDDFRLDESIKVKSRSGERFVIGGVNVLGDASQFLSASVSSVSDTECMISITSKSGDTVMPVAVSGIVSIECLIDEEPLEVVVRILLIRRR